MVRILQQNSVSRQAFDQWVKDKQRSERTQHKEALKGILPGGAVEFLSGLNQFEQSLKGSMGEAKVFLDTLIFLPDNWILFNDVFLQPAPEQYAQLDHLLGDPARIFIIKTKAWNEAFVSFTLNWAVNQTLLTVTHLAAILIQRHVKVKATASPDDPTFAITGTVAKLNWVKPTGKRLKVL